MQTFLDLEKVELKEKGHEDCRNLRYGGDRRDNAPWLILPEVVGGQAGCVQGEPRLHHHHQDESAYGHDPCIAQDFQLAEIPKLDEA